MRIGVIGTGHIGGTLGAKWLAAGHEVVYGARRASGEGPGGAPVRPVSEALADAEVGALAGVTLARVLGAPVRVRVVRAFVSRLSCPGQAPHGPPRDPNRGQLGPA